MFAVSIAINVIKYCMISRQDYFIIKGRKMRLMPLAFAALACVAPLAHASYYVIDNPPPQPVSGLIRSLPEFASRQEYMAPLSVAFARRSAQIAKDAAKTLTTALDKFRDAASVSIEGCGDPGDNESIAYRRAAAVKAWLLDNGVDASVINTSADGSVTKTQHGYACLVRAATRSAPPAYVPFVGRELGAAVVAPAAPVATAPAQPQTRSEQMRMIDRVLDMVRMKIVTPDNALAMIQQLMKEADGLNTVSRPGGMGATPVVAQIMPLQAPVQSYVLTANHTLRDTLSEWARSAGWREPVWLASNPYLIAQGQSLGGDFMGALHTVSDLVPGLDFRVNTATHEITVVDAGR